MKFKQYIFSKSANLRLPITGTFELTPRCNMNCKMCYIKMTEKEMAPIGKELDTERWIQIFNEANAEGLLYLLLTGGEPFLHQGFFDIYSHAYTNGTVMSVNSNATLIGERQVAFLEKMPPEHINITVYGPDNATYERLCGNPHGFDQLNHALSLLDEAKIRYHLNCSLTTQNREQLPDIIKFAASREHELNIATYMFPPVRKNPEFCHDKVNIRLTAEECGKAMAYLNAKKDPDRMAKMLKEFDEKIPVENENICPDTMMKCMAGRNSFWITWHGTMKACAMFPDEVTLDSGFTEAWKQTVQNCNDIRMPAECETCAKKAFCKSCAAVNKAEGDDFNKVPDFMCRFAESYIEHTKEYLKWDVTE